MRRVSLLLLLALVAGCGPDKHLELDLRGVSITVPRLVTPAIVLVPPAVTPPPVSLPPLPPSVVVAPPITPPLVPVPVPASCPKASTLAVPDKPVSPLITAAPADDTFVETLTGTAQGQVITTVKRLPSTTSTTGQKVDSWLVGRTDSAHHSSMLEAYQLVHPAASPAGTPSGVYLVGLAVKDPVLGDLTFQAAGLGLEILPNPVAADSTGGTQYAGAATDPATLTTMALIRNVTGRQRVDVCGELIETFTVEMSGTLVSPDTQLQISWTQQVSTSYGVAEAASTLALTSVTGGSSWIRSLRRTTMPKDAS